MGIPIWGNVGAAPGHAPLTGFRAVEEVAVGTQRKRTKRAREWNAGPLAYVRPLIAFCTRMDMIVQSEWSSSNQALQKVLQIDAEEPKGSEDTRDSTISSCMPSAPVADPGQAAARQRAADDLNRETKMPRVSLNQPAPNFSLPDFSGNMISLSDFHGRKNVLLVFNRGFA